MRPERGANQTELGAGLVDLLPGVGGLSFPVGGPGCKFLLEAIKLLLECENPSDGLLAPHLGRRGLGFGGVPDAVEKALALRHHNCRVMQGGTPALAAAPFAFILEKYTKKGLASVR